MPMFVRISNGDNYRTKGSRFGLWHGICKRLGLMVRFVEDPSGNALYVSGKHIVHAAVISDEQLAAALAAKQEAEQGKRIQPAGMIPRKH